MAGDLIVTGVDTGMLGALVTVAPDGTPLASTVLKPGKRTQGWTTPCPRQVSMVGQQMRRHVEFNAPDCIAYEQVSTTRGIAAARSLFICEGLLLAIANHLELSAWPVQQNTMRAWVKRYLAIGKWKKGQGKQQILDAMGVELVRDLVELTGHDVPERRWPDLADAYLCARWAQATIQTKGAG